MTEAERRLVIVEAMRAGFPRWRAERVADTVERLLRLFPGWDGCGLVRTQEGPAQLGLGVG